MSSYGLWLSAAGMKVNQHRQAVLANNLANANTTGFKHDLAVVMQRQVESAESPGGFSMTHPVLDTMGGGLDVRPTYKSFEQGSIETTGKPLDVAIDGDGFLAVSDGEVTRYTRDGVLAINKEGELVLAAGNGRWRVLDEGGARISVNEDVGAASISANGDVRQGKLVVATLGLVTTQDKQALQKVGENLFDAEQAEMVPANGHFVSESRENSNFGVMRGLAATIEAARAYQLNATMIQLQDQITGRAVNSLGRSR